MIVRLLHHEWHNSPARYPLLHSVPLVVGITLLKKTPLLLIFDFLIFDCAGEVVPVINSRHPQLCA